MPTVLEFRQVTKTFPGVRALRDVDIAVERATVHALLGENGAGKSTVVNLIGGVHQPDSGEVLLDGEVVRFDSPRDSIARGIAVIHQELTLVPELSVAENIYLGRLPSRGFGGVDWSRLRSEATAVLQRIGLNVRPDVSVGQLSTGEQQQVEIARALSSQPKLLLMDEPTSALTMREIKRLFEVIESLKGEGLTVLFISHELEEVFAIADWLTVLRDGAVVTSRACADMTAGDIAGAMLGHAIDASRTVRSIAQTTAEPALAVHALSNARLADISLQVAAGEVLGLAGLMGAGRTELLRAICGADAAQGGIRLNGQPVQLRSPADAVRHRVFLVPEDRQAQGLVMGMSVAENIVLPSLSHHVRFGFVDRRGPASVIGEQIRRLRIKTSGGGQDVASLSGGNQQKVILARWLSMDPKVLLLDQPTRGLDIGAKEDVYQIVRDLAASGVAVIFVATDIPELLRVCNRIHVLRNGRTAAVLNANDCSERDVLLAAMGTA